MDLTPIPTDGPWHSGFAVTVEVLGQYVTIVCGNPDVAVAVAEFIGKGPSGPPELATVGRLPHQMPAPAARRRI